MTFTILNAQLQEFYDGALGAKKFNLNTYIELIVTCLVMYVLIKQIPQIVSGFLSGSPALGGGSAIGMAKGAVAGSKDLAGKAVDAGKAVYSGGASLVGQYMAAKAANMADGGGKNPGFGSNLMTMGKGMAIGMAASALKPLHEGFDKALGDEGTLRGRHRAKTNPDGKPWEQQSRFDKLMSAVNGMSQKEDQNNNTVGGRWQNRANPWRKKDPGDHGGGPDNDYRK